MANSVDPDQTAPSGAVWSGSALFAYVILSETLVFEFLGHLPYSSVRVMLGRTFSLFLHYNIFLDTHQSFQLPYLDDLDE